MSSTLGPATRTLTGEFYRNARPMAIVGCVSLSIAISIQAFLGFGDSPSRVLVSVCIGVLGMMLICSTPRAHHWNLPVSAEHLTRVLVANAWLSGVVLIAVLLQVLALISDRPWNVLLVATSATAIYLVCVALARLIAGQESEAVGIWVAACVGWWVNDLIQAQPWYVVLAASFAMTLMAWRLFATAIKRDRLGLPTLASRWQRWELSLSRKRREYRTKFSAPEQAVFQLDWMRLRVGVIGGVLALVVALGGLPLLLDPSIVLLPFVAFLGPATAVLATGTFMETDLKVNGEFRWNLPVPDEVILRSLRKDILVTLSIFVLGCYAGFLLVATYLYSTDQLSFLANNQRSSFPGGFAGLVLASTIAVPVQFAVGWISAMRGLEISLLGRGLTCRQIVLLFAWFLGTYATFRYVPDSYRPLVWGGWMAVAGIAMCIRTVTAFRWSRFMDVVSAKWLSRLIAIWLAGSIVGVGLLLGFGYTNLGWHALVIGLVAMLLQPFAALPIAVYARRHWC